MTFRARRDRLLSILTGSNCIHPGSVYDAISIRIAEDLGFEIGMFGGSVASLAVLGDPDIALITLTEFAEQMRRMSRASSLPVVVDADHGYGNGLKRARRGRCRPCLRQRAERAPYDRRIGDCRRRRPHHRGYAAATGFRRDEDTTDFAGRRRRQDEGGAGCATRSVAGRHRAHWRGVDLLAG